MTKQERADRIRTLSHELSILLAEENPQRPIKFLSAADLPLWVAEGLKAAVRRKIAEDAPGVH
jgi:hypothetical protein